MSESLVRRGPGRPRGTSTPIIESMQLKKMNRFTVETVFAELMQKDLSHLKETLQNPDLPMLHLIVARIIKRAFETADPSVLNFILDRTIGKVREQIDVDMVVEERLRKHDELLKLVPRGQLIEMVRVEQKAVKDE